MFQIIEFSRADPRPLFYSDAERRRFLSLSQRLSRRWGVAPLAFRLGPSWAAFLVQGAAAGAGSWCRLLQSGYGVWRYHQGDPLLWRPSVRVPLPDEPSAREAADTLHRGLEPDPLLPCWSSLRDAMGLRRAPWFDGGWLAARGGPALYTGAGGRDRTPGALAPPALGWTRIAPRDPWTLIEQAVAAATGQDPRARGVRSLRVQVAWARGWSVTALVRALEIQERTVRRTLSRRPCPDVERALLHLEDPRLRMSLGSFSGVPVKRWDLPEPPWSHLHSSSQKLASSSPAA